MNNKRTQLNKAQVAGLVRTVLCAFSGYLLGKGVNIAPFASPEIVDLIASLILTLSGLWTIQTHKTKRHHK